MARNRLFICLIIASGTLFEWSWAYALRDFPLLRLLCLCGLGLAVFTAWRFQG